MPTKTVNLKTEQLAAIETLQDREEFDSFSAAARHVVQKGIDAELSEGEA